MSLDGTTMPGGLLFDLHAKGCEGHVVAYCQPLVVRDHDQPTYQRDRGAQIVVVMLAWCSKCHAAEWEVV